MSTPSRAAIAEGERIPDVTFKTRARTAEKSDNPFDWRGDSKKRMPYTHALSLAKNEHGVGTVTVKTVAVLVATFFGTMHPTAVSMVRVGCISRPHHNHS